MYYVDCACESHDIWKEFPTAREAKTYFDNLSCKDKIVYSFDGDGNPIKVLLQEA